MPDLTTDVRCRNVYSVCALVVALLANQISFQGGRLLAFWRYHLDFTTALDLKIPFAPWTILIYFGAYLFWAVSLYFCSRQDRERSDRLFCADILSKIVSFLFFVVLPTTNVRPLVEGSGVFNFAMRFLYFVDRPDNLFPSIHCSMSWLCWIWVRGKKELPLGWRAFSLLCAAAICVSTLTTRQHVLADVIGGVILAEICYVVAADARVRGVYTRLMDRLMLTVSHSHVFEHLHL